MNQKTARIIAIVIVIAMVITSFSFVFMAPALFGAKGSVAYGAEKATLTTDQELNRQMELLEQYIQYLKKNFKDPVDYQQMIDGAFTGATEALGDPYTVYYVSDKDSSSFVETVSGQFSGIGVTIEKDPMGARVVSTFLGGPAEKAGIKAGDVILQVDNETVKERTLEEISSILRGPVSTSVTVIVRRGADQKSYSIIREVVKTISVSKEKIQGNVGVIRITSFDNDTGSEFEIALRELIGQGAEKIIIDLRNNGGGLVGSAFDVADTLIREGVIVNFTNQGKLVETVKASQRANYNLPTVILVNENTASAAEILAGALQDHQKAALVGKTTFGKGIAQIVTDAGNGSQVKVSAYYFTTPLGRTIHETGIIPDYVIDSYEKKGPETIALYESFAPMSENIKYGPSSVGLNVYGAQQRLSLMGYDLPVSGIMDTASTEGIRKFQRSQGLYPYGVLDFTTRNKLAAVTYDYVYGTGGTDRQLEKALELLKSN
jgi:carboxyl-terminal processing protease